MLNQALFRSSTSVQLIRMLSSKIRLRGRDFISNTVRKSGYSFKIAKELKGESHDEKNKRLNRPLSPHLSIYKWQNNMIMSITHRATGAVLSGLLSGLAIVVTFSSMPFSNLIEILQGANLSPILLLSSKFCIALTLSFHMLNGIRHLIWDSGYMLHSKTVDVTGYLVFMISFVLAIHLTMLDG